jgi:hypothetical protein
MVWRSVGILTADYMQIWAFSPNKRKLQDRTSMSMRQKKNFTVYSAVDGVVSRKKNDRFFTKRKLLVAFAILTLTILGSAHEFSAPNYGHVTHSGGPIIHQAVPAPKIAEAPASTTQNIYYELNLPGGYKPQSNGQPMPGLLYQQTIIKQSASGSQVIAIGITDSPGGMSNLSSYQLRQQASGHYERTTITIHNEQIILFADTQSPSVVAFWEHQGRVATIGATAGVAEISDDGTKTQRAALLPVLDGWQWR